MLSGDGNENSQKKKTVGLIAKKKQLCTGSTLFLEHFFAVVLQDDNVKLPETSQLHILWRKCCMWSCSLFFAAALFQLGGRYHFSFSHSCYKMSCYSANEIGLLSFFYLWLQLFLCYPTNVDFKIKSKERIGFVVVVFYL